MEHLANFLDGRGAGRHFGRNEDFEIDYCVDKLTDAYMHMAMGIHEAVHNAAGDPFKTPRVEKQVTGYLNGDPLSWQTILLVDDKEPEYVTEYKSVRRRAFHGMLNEAIRSNDYDFLLGTVQNFRDPELAGMLLKELDQKKMPTPHFFAGNIDRFKLDQAANHKRVDGIKRSTREYALAVRNRGMQIALHSESTGLMGAIAIWGRAKMRTRIDKYVDKVFYEPLEEVKALPLIEKQLLDKEIAGLTTDQQLRIKNSIFQFVEPE